MMNRNFILFVIAVVVAGRMSACLKGPGGIARGQTSATQAVLQDNFDDNKKGAMWKLFGENAKAKATEANKRLEFTATSDVNVPFMGYIGEKWWIDPNQDFQMKLDLNFNIYTYASGWVSFGITPKAAGPGDQYVALGIGCSSVYQNYWREWRDGYEVRMDFVGRVKPLVTLYISYDSWYDVLYLSDSGYGPDEAWQTLPGLVRGRWGRVPLYLFLGAKTEGLMISAGDAYIDNFVIEKGKIGSPYPATDPTQPPGGGGGQVLDVAATVAVMPSVIKRQASGDKIVALVSLPKEVALAHWDPANVPTLSPGGLTATTQTAFTWVDCTVKILMTFSKTKLMQALPENGKVEVHVIGKLKDGRSYAGSCEVTIQ